MWLPAGAQDGDGVGDAVAAGLRARSVFGKRLREQVDRAGFPPRSRGNGKDQQARRAQGLQHGGVMGGWHEVRNVRILLVLLDGDALDGGGTAAARSATHGESAAERDGVVEERDRADAQAGCVLLQTFGDQIGEGGCLSRFGTFGRVLAAGRQQTQGIGLVDRPVPIGGPGGLGGEAGV